MNQRKKHNSSKVNLTISAIFHTVMILAVFFFAAREGMLGKKLKELTVTMAPKEKKPEAPKEKPAEQKIETPKAVETKAVIPQPRAETAAAPPPASDVPAIAPASTSLPAFEFSDGAKEVQSISDVNGIYKALVEHTLRSRWERPEDMADDNYVAEVELAVDPSGKVEDSRWLSGSGDKRWDDSVKTAVARTHAISRPPPKGFPEKFLVRFDVQGAKTESVIQLSSR